MDPELNYITSNRFYVEMQSTITASFQECSGLGASIETEKFNEGGVNDQQRIMLKGATFDDVTLKRGMTNDIAFLGWASRMFTQLNASGSDISTYRRNINILMFNQAGETVQVWTLIGAIPTKWSGPSFSADGSDVVVEELTISYEGLAVTVNSSPSAASSGSATIHSSGRDTSTGGYFSSS
ncbi:MAG: phage tail protein [Spirulina sp. SIO3F2]|nr:phage tail protein [Spirulina sp. SIO3F2]